MVIFEFRLHLPQGKQHGVRRLTAPRSNLDPVLVPAEDQISTILSEDSNSSLDMEPNASRSTRILAGWH
jgi:hypothetical protein